MSVCQLVHHYYISKSVGLEVCADIRGPSLIILLSHEWVKVLAYSVKKSQHHLIFMIPRRKQEISKLKRLVAMTFSDTEDKPSPFWTLNHLTKQKCQLCAQDIS